MDRNLLAPTAILATILVCLMIMTGAMYARQYNEAMVQCLEHHSRDVCVETLR